VNGLRGAVADYLTVRRTLGFQLAGAGLLLEQFVDFAEAAHTDAITTELAVRWATLPSGGSPSWHAQRLSVVRCFARWLQAFDPAVEVPPVDLLPAHTGRRATPYLYSDTDVTAMMAAAGRLRSPLAAGRPEDKTFIGLMFATRLRRGEAPPPCNSGPIPAPGHAARLPQGAVIMPSTPTQIPYPTNDSTASSA